MNMEIELHTYIVYYMTGKGLAVKEIRATNEREAMKEARLHGKPYAGPTKKIDLPDKIVRPDQY